MYYIFYRYNYYNIEDIIHNAIFPNLPTLHPMWYRSILSQIFIVTRFDKEGIKYLTL